MALNLLNSFGRRGVSYGLYTKPADVIDTEYLSKFFVVSEFSPTFTAGKNSFLFNGSTYLKPGSEILIECLDSQKNNLYIEIAKYSGQSSKIYAYKESTSYVFSIHVYNDIADGVGKIILYGKLFDDRTVKWVQNITINKTLKNNSRVRLYTTPEIEVDSVEVPVLSSIISTGLIENVILMGKVQGLPVNPPKDANLSLINKRNTDIDYRLIATSPNITNVTLPTQSFNSQMVGSVITLHVNKIQLPASQKEASVDITSSYKIEDVINNTTLKIGVPFFYKDFYGNEAVVNVIDADFAIPYPFVNYNNATSSYQSANITGSTYIIKKSYADIIYKNIRTFSGYVARHKIYRRSLLSNADFSVMADEPITINEVLADQLTQNKYYHLLGKFYNPNHINRYWFTSSNNLHLTHSPSFAIDSMFVSSSNFLALTGSDYFMVKNDSVNTEKNATYISFSKADFLAESSSIYDSNFMALRANTQYIIEMSTVILKAKDETTAGLSFYITSSIEDISKEFSFTPQYGVKVAQIVADKENATQVNFEKVISFFTPQKDLYGTLVVVPRLCNSYIKNISFRVYGDDGFSPDVFTTRIPWDISVANESFDIKAELLDINSNLIYSDLRALQSFDFSGSTILPAEITASVIPYSSSIHPLIPLAQTGSIYYYKNISGTNTLRLYNGTAWVGVTLT